MGASHDSSLSSIETFTEHEKDTICGVRLMARKGLARSKPATGGGSCEHGGPLVFQTFEV